MESAPSTLGNDIIDESTIPRELPGGQEDGSNVASEASKGGGGGRASKATNYTAAVNKMIADKINEAKQYKPVKNDTIWTTLGLELDRGPNTLYTHWNAIINAVKYGRSKLGREYPVSSASNENLDQLVEKYFADLFQLMTTPDPKLTKSWFSVELLKAVVKMQRDDEQGKGIDKIQNAETLAAAHLKAKNKFEADTIARKEAMEKDRLAREAAEKKKEEDKKTYQDQLLGCLTTAATAMKELATSSTGTPGDLTGTPAAEIVDLTKDVNDIRSDVNELKNTVNGVQETQLEILSILRKRPLD